MDLILFNTPIGRLGLCSCDGAHITRVILPGGPCPLIAERETPLLTQGRRQLLEYFSGARTAFDLPLRWEATPFRDRVWRALSGIPYGQTISYAELARRAGSPKAVRAVGQANHFNPLPILVPCHRVVGKDGSLTGYAGGLAIKEFLLKLEGVSYGKK